MEYSSGNSMKPNSCDAKQHHVLGQARKMHGQRREREQIFEREIAIAHRIQAIAP